MKKQRAVATPSPRVQAFNRFYSEAKADGGTHEQAHEFASVRIVQILGA